MSQSNNIAGQPTNLANMLLKEAGRFDKLKGWVDKGTKAVSKAVGTSKPTMMQRLGIKSKDPNLLQRLGISPPPEPTMLEQAASKAKGTASKAVAAVRDKAKPLHDKVAPTLHKIEGKVAPMFNTAKDKAVVLGNRASALKKDKWDPLPAWKKNLALYGGGTAALVGGGAAVNSALASTGHTEAANTATTAQPASTGATGQAAPASTGTSKAGPPAAPPPQEKSFLDKIGLPVGSDN
jgi:hypothetical protein